jgi:cyclopropane fatty-acyl-phospholipid synthase-like methyltransferase
MRTVGEIATGDWSYHEAKRRLVVAGRRRLQRHAASVRLDEAANPIVDCGCGWTGNAIGWAQHLDQVVASSLDGEATRATQG